MKRKDNHFKVICGFFLCAVILTGCSGGHQAGEEFSVEDGSEEPKVGIADAGKTDTGKTEETETGNREAEPKSASIEADREASKKDKIGRASCRERV